VTTLTTAGPLDAGSRLLRLLALLAYLANAGEATIAELAARFSMSEANVVTELELAACCGLPPYTPDQLLELVVDDTKVIAYGLESLRRPAQLTPEEGFAVAAAARALLAVPGGANFAALKGALDKLEQVLGPDEVRVELDEPEHLGELRRAAADGAEVEIDYLGARRGEESVRVVEPFAVVAREGQFYLDAYCHLAVGWRRFQVDRVRRVTRTGRSVQARAMPSELSGSRAFVGGPSVRLARVSVPAGRQVLLERVAAGPPEPDGTGRVTVPVEVADEQWFGVLLLRLGADANLLGPESLRGARAVAARRILDRYERAAPERGPAGEAD
jgi:proteasome accessory factor C